jgi:hypothetical protein
LNFLWPILSLDCPLDVNPHKAMLTLTRIM